ncbi:MAG: 50S ribosomal protein L19 [Planctomycetota bacterium]|nr:50S ribosomal protein L19 [Planctomycetota bacterium]
MDIVDGIEKRMEKKEIPSFRIGDTVDVHLRIKEGDKERVQVFTGTVISRRGTGAKEMFTVRRIVQGEGVERIFPIHSPLISDLKVTRSGKVRRGKLYYLRDRVGKATRVKERRRDVRLAGEDVEKRQAKEEGASAES